MRIGKFSIKLEKKAKAFIIGLLDPTVAFSIFLELSAYVNLLRLVWTSLHAVFFSTVYLPLVKQRQSSSTRDQTHSRV